MIFLIDIYITIDGEPRLAIYLLWFEHNMWCECVGDSGEMRTACDLMLWFLLDKEYMTREGNL